MDNITGPTIRVSLPAAREKKAPASAECTGAVQLDWPEMHRRCAGNTTIRIPSVPIPVLTYRCGCTCHTDGDCGGPA